MNIGDILFALKNRAPWRFAASRLLKRAGFHVGHGWGDTEASVVVEAAKDDTKRAALERSLMQHLVAGEKTLRLYSIEGVSAATVGAFGGALRRSVKNLLTEDFPKYLTDDELREMDDIPPKFVNRIEYTSGTAYFFVGIRSYSERKELSPEVLKDGVPDRKDFSNVYGVVNKRRQICDVIWIPKDGSVVCVAADAPDVAPGDFSVESHLALSKRLKRHFGDDLRAINLRPAVSNLYWADEGAVVELGFVTDDDSVKHMKARQGKPCLRRDRYHAAGSEVVGDALRPFKVAVRWQRQSDEKHISLPEVLLPGTARAILDVDLNLPMAEFRHGLNISDLKFVVSKLYGYATQDNRDERS